MPLDIDRLNKLTGKEASEKKFYLIENFINITVSLCCIFNQWLVEVVGGVAGLIYIAIKNLWLLGAILFIWLVLERFLNALCSIIKNFIVSIISIPLRAIAPPLFLLVHLVIDSIVCWFISMLATGYIYTLLKTNSVFAFIFATIIATILTKGIFLTETANPEIIELSKTDYNINITVNYTVIFAASLYFANILSIATLLLGIKGLLSLGIYLAVLILPALIYIITECIKPRIERN